MPRPYRMVDRSQEREYDGWTTQYIHDNQWLERIQADRMFTDGPHIHRGLRNSTIVLSPTIQRQLSATLVKKFFWINGKLRVKLHLFPSSANPGDIKVILSVYAFKLEDIGDTGGTLLKTQTETLTLTSEGLHTLIWQLDEPLEVVQDGDVTIGFHFDHNPVDVENTYPDKAYTPGCEIDYQSLVRQQ